MEATPPQTSCISEPSSPPKTPPLRYLAVEHFLDRSHEMHMKRSLLHPLSKLRVAWRWLGSLLLLAYSLSIVHAAYWRYHCDADEYCDPSSQSPSSSAAEERRRELGVGVRFYSGSEVLYALAAPPPGGVDSLADLASAQHLFWFSRVSLPVDALLALPWFDICAVAYPQAVALASKLRGVDNKQGAAAAAAATSKPWRTQLSTKVYRWLSQRGFLRAINALRRVRALKPPPKLLQPLLDEYVLPVLFARNFGTGHLAALRLMRALPKINDALWEAEIAQAFLLNFVVSTKALVLVVSSLHALRTRLRLKRRRRLVAEQQAARRVAKHARRFLVHSQVGHLQAAQRTAEQMAAITAYRNTRHSARHSARRSRDGAGGVNC